ncbi:MAG: DNA primase [Spirochaetaceae bacterium]
MARIPEKTLQEISDKINIADVVSDYVTLENKGSRYWGLCPFHSEKTPSFSVAPEKNLFYCFGCHKGGSVFTFLMEVEHISFVEAVQLLAQRAGVSLESAEQSETGTEEQALSELYERTHKMFRYFLVARKEGEKARSYIKERGVSEETEELFGLGYSPEDRRWLYGFLRKKNYSPSFLAKSGLFSRRYPEISLFSGRLVFPIRRTNGKVVAFGGRSLDGGEPKYINSPDTELYRKKTTLFGLYEGAKEIRRSREVLVVEGYFDVIAFFDAGIPRAVAPLGTSLTEEQGRVLKRYSDRAVLIFDDDRAGREAAVRAIEVCEKAGLDCSVVIPEGGKDPADILANEGSESLQYMLKYTINSFEYLIDSAVKRLGKNSPEEKSRVVSAVSGYLKSVRSEVRRQEYIRRLAEVLDITTDAVQSDYDVHSYNETTHYKGQEAVDKKDREIGTDLFLMLAAAAHSRYFPVVRRDLEVRHLKDERARELYIAMEEAFRNDEGDVESIVGRIENEGLRSLVYSKAVSEEFSINAEQIIKDGVRKIKIRSLEERRKEVRQKMSRIDKEGSETEKRRDLLSEKMYIDEELKRLKGNM